MKNFDQNFIHIKQLLTLNLTKIYTLENFNEKCILNKTFRFLLIKRFEKQNLQLRISFHIRYDKLSKIVTIFINSKLRIEQNQIQNAFAIMFSNSK